MASLGTELISLGALMTMNYDQVVLLDSETDHPIGVADKTLAHTSGYYHSATSVILIDSAGRQLIQQRALSKYHCAGLWSNACCTHPKHGEDARDAALRRLGEELGITTRLVSIGVVRYKARVPAKAGNGCVDRSMMEHERVELFGGFYDGPCWVNADEVADTQWKTIPELKAAVGHQFTPWFQLYLHLLGPMPIDLLKGLMATTINPRDYGYLQLTG
ncbi:MAG: NUDIX domain-containing protein [Rhizobiales bacterium]|nr:NUDIX domain-containing protein [Hyphomicrobiales bacterium]